MSVTMIQIKASDEKIEAIEAIQDATIMNRSNVIRRLIPSAEFAAAAAELANIRSHDIWELIYNKQRTMDLMEKLLDSGYRMCNSDSDFPMGPAGVSRMTADAPDPNLKWQRMAVTQKADYEKTLCRLFANFGKALRGVEGYSIRREEVENNGQVFLAVGPDDDIEMLRMQLASFFVELKEINRQLRKESGNK